MRSLRVLILLSAVLMLSGLVFTSTTAFAGISTKTAVVLVCAANDGILEVYRVSPTLICNISPVQTNGNIVDCGPAISALLNARCEIENSFAQTNAQPFLASQYLFICRGTPCQQ